MKKQLLLGIDIGSSSAKGLIIDNFGTEISKYEIKHSFAQPYPGWAEQDPDQSWWPETVEIIKQCIAKGKVNSSHIKAIGVTGMVPNISFLDEGGRSLRPSILYRDNRAALQCDRLNKDFGLNFNTQDMLPKWIWVKENEPDVFNKITFVLNTHSYLIYKLTGIKNIDCDTAELFGEIYDSKSMSWKNDLVEKLGLDTSALPQIFRQTKAVGCVSYEVSNLTGLSCDTKVYAGNGDSLMSMIGTGVVNAGDTMLYLGTAATVISIDKDLNELREGLVFGSGHVHFEGNVLTGAESLSWFRSKLQLGKPLDFEELNQLAENIPCGCDGLIVLPHFEGQRTPTYKPLAFASIIGLNTKHTGANIYRGLMEGIAFAILDSIEKHLSEMKRFVVSGGGAKSLLFRQIFSDVLNRPIEFCVKNSAALGTAYFAGLSNGIFNDFESLHQEWLKEKEVTMPIPENVNFYRKQFKRYRQISKTIATLYKDQR